jgi:hypothetical protein
MAMLHPAVSAVESRHFLQFGLLLLLAVAFRAAAFGDPAVHTDEQFYFLIGQKMLDGQLPYVDIWDRKPWGLFALYSIFAAISRSVWTYQIAATLFAALTAFVIVRVSSRLSGDALAMVPGALYLALLSVLGGHGGQAPVFYNLLVASALFLIVRSMPRLESGQIPRSIYLAMLLCGLALTIKQTAAPESAFFGLFVIMVTWRAGAPLLAILRSAALFMLLGAGPSVAIAVGFALAGHWPEFYQAVVSSNFAKAEFPLAVKLVNMSVIASILWAPLLLAATGLVLQSASLMRLLLAGWLVSAFSALLLVQNFFGHYALSILTPLCCACAALFARLPWAVALAVWAGGDGLVRAKAFSFAEHRTSRDNVEHLADAIRRHAPRDTLLVFDGPVYLFAMTDTRPLSNLVLPWHLKETIERHASGRDAIAELSRILAQRPSAVTLRRSGGSSWRENPEARMLVRQYVDRNCQFITETVVYEGRFWQPAAVYGDCR